jgi:hypothetical protein
MRRGGARSMRVVIHSKARIVALPLAGVNEAARRRGAGELQRYVALDRGGGWICGDLLLFLLRVGLAPEPERLAGELEGDARLEQDLVEQGWVGLLDRELHDEVVEDI